MAATMSRAPGPAPASGDASFFMQVKLRGSSTSVQPGEGEGYAAAATRSASSLASLGSDRSRGPSAPRGAGPPDARLSGEGAAGGLRAPWSSAGGAVGSFPRTGAPTPLASSSSSSSSEGGVGAPRETWPSCILLNHLLTTRAGRRTEEEILSSSSPVGSAFRAK
ncbi:hypothetical protein EYF80_054419 [Liparis tanakae]|uniref:Uncharacterized protein n=1 Tax=Liparis tanakae TaxID=230148 RepID=A0A4Z2F4J9_9TELE|nr:hypothetical protein EYF80_054419 [Liparis tanakae]